MKYLLIILLLASCQSVKQRKPKTSMENKHTPGPWIISELNDAIDGEEDILIEHEGFPLCSVRGTNDMSCFDDDEEIEKTNVMVIANALLIAASPTMLEALQACEVTLKAFLPEAFATIEVVQEAIKKAKG